MNLKQNTIEKEIKKLTNKNIKLEIQHRKRKGVYSCCRTIEFNETTDFNLVELDGALAHEIVHIEEKHLIKLMLYIILLALSIVGITLIILTDIKVHLNLFCSLAIILTALIIPGFILYITLGRHFERVADKKAAEKVGKVPMIRALEKISTWKESDRLDLTHDKPRKRIENLKKLDLPDFIKLK